MSDIWVTRIWGAFFILMSPALFTVPLREFDEIDLDCFSDNWSLRAPSTAISAACTNDKKNQPCYNKSVNEFIWDLKGSLKEHWKRLTLTPGTPSVRNYSSSAAPKPPIRCNVTSQWKWIIQTFSQITMYMFTKIYVHRQMEARNAKSIMPCL